MTTSRPMVDKTVVNDESDETWAGADIPLLETNSHDQEESSVRLRNAQICETTFRNDDSCMKHESHKLNSAVWTTHATSTLVQLYEAKLEMLETPKKKTRIWIAISENLKDYDIDVTPDQVRWKINALTKKYKHCLHMGKHDKFKYFKEMDNIYANYNVDCDSYSITEFLSKKKLKDESRNLCNNSKLVKCLPETKAIIEMRKARLAKRIDCDRFQGKIKLERQWLEYLRIQEEQKRWKDKIFERNLKLREDILNTRKKELDTKESIECRKLQLMKQQNEASIQIEKDKFELLKQLFYQ